MNGKIVLFADKKDCCGCSACASICPAQCITMIRDEHGFMYPEIDESECILCRRCIKVCSLKQV